jgi:hypothetical protein
VEITPTKEQGKARYALWAAFALLLLLFTSAHDVWRPWTADAVTPAFAQVVWALNMIYVAAIFGNVLLLVSNPWWLRVTVELVLATVGLLAGIHLYRVFPFDLARFGDAAVVLGHGVLFFILLTLGVSIFVSLVRLASGTRWPRRPVHG